MAERLTPRTLDLEVRGSSLARRVDSLEKEFYSTLSLFAQMYNGYRRHTAGGYHHRHHYHHHNHHLYLITESY